MPAPQITQTLVAPVRGSGGAAYTATADAFAAALPAWAGQANAQADYLDALALSVTGSGAFTNVTATGTVSAGGKVILPITPATALAATSGTSLNFTGIPTTANRVTVLFNGLSTNGAALPQVQIGSGSIVTTGYFSAAADTPSSGAASSSATTGFLLATSTFWSAARLLHGSLVLTRVDGNIWVSSLSAVAESGAVDVYTGAGRLVLSGALDRVRITTVGGTDTFDAGSVNIAWE